jgi:hypothetical protein
MKTQADLLNFRVAELLTFRLPKTLKNLKMRHLKGELHLSDHEYKALSDWLNKSSGGKRDK